jgi:hypothetical protein
MPTLLSLDFVTFMYWKFGFQNQVSREIKYTVWSLPWMSIPTVSLFLLELRGFSKLYDNIGEFPYGK